MPSAKHWLLLAALGLGPGSGMGMAETAAAPASPPATQFLPRQVEIGQRDDAQQDGWTTEVAAAAISAQLDLLKQWWAAVGEVPPGFPPLLATDFHAGACQKLVTKQLLDGGLRREQFASHGPLTRDNRYFLHHRQALPTPEKGLVHVKLLSVVDQGAAWLCLLDWECSLAGNWQENAAVQSRWSKESPPRLLTWEVISRDFLSKPQPAMGFRDITVAALAGDAVWADQIAHGTDHWTARLDSALGMDVNGWCGVTLGDVNGDGLEDIYLPQQGGLPNRMLVRQKDGTLRDITAASQTGWLDHSHAALLVDFDNDGDADLAVSMSDGILFQENDGHGKFTVKSAKLAPSGYPHGLGAADYDQDGDLDVFAACYHQRTGAGNGGHFTFARPIPYQDATNGAEDMLLRNDGRWTFTNVARSVGLMDQKFGFAPSWQDVDGDGDQDLYVANDFGANLYWLQEKDDLGLVQFRESSKLLGIQDVAAGMSACWGDVNNDTLADLYVGNMFSAAGNRIASQAQFQAQAPAETRQQLLRHARGNSLFLQGKAPAGFTDASESAEVTLGRWAWSSRMVDLNNDGWLDLHVANGYITQEDTHDL